jgi:hypothetical protein
MSMTWHFASLAGAPYPRQTDRHAAAVVMDDDPLPRIELGGDMVLTLLGPTAY